MGYLLKQSKVQRQVFWNVLQLYFGGVSLQTWSLQGLSGNRAWRGWGGEALGPILELGSQDMHRGGVGQSWDLLRIDSKGHSSADDAGSPLPIWSAALPH